jgi:putative membrane protein
VFIGDKAACAAIGRQKGESIMYYFGGMHLYWWFLWIFIWVLFFSFMMPVRRTTYRQMQSPLQLLQRRYAAGEITSDEYEERRTKLLRDSNMK